MNPFHAAPPAYLEQKKQRISASLFSRLSLLSLTQSLHSYHRNYVNQVKLKFVVRVFLTFWAPSPSANVFRPHYSGRIQKRNNHRSFWIWLRETWSGKSRDYRDVIVFKKGKGFSVPPTQPHPKIYRVAPGSSKNMNHCRYSCPLFTLILAPVPTLLHFLISAQ